MADGIVFALIVAVVETVCLITCAFAVGIIDMVGRWLEDKYG